jgi:hypothetical protein
MRDEGKTLRVRLGCRRRLRRQDFELPTMKGWNCMVASIAHAEILEGTWKLTEAQAVQ